MSFSILNNANRGATSRISIAVLIAFCALFLFPPKNAFAWGAGMHATLNAQAYERMTQRWKDAVDRDLIIYAAWTPDAWYILSEEMLSGSCGIACGGPDDAASNECFNDYDADRYFSYSRHLLVNADGLKTISYALGYAGHQVGDYRGHLEYIIPGWRDPQGTASIPISRHTFIDSTADALAFNVDGLYGYPTKYLADKALYGYPHEFLTANNALTVGTRNVYGGLSVSVDTNYAGKRKAVWKGILDETAKGMQIASVTGMMDDAALDSVSEGLVAALYGVTAFDPAGRRFPVVITGGSVAINCSTDLKQRMEHENGFGNPMACQVALANISGLAQFSSYIAPADETTQEIVVNKEKVAEWMRNIAVEYKSGDTYLDDPHVFSVDPDTGKSKADIKGIDGRHYTLDRTMPQIVDDVLDKNIQDITDRLLENPHVIGTILQSKANAFDKSRFVSFGFHYRPRLTAWPAAVTYNNEAVKTLPETPGSLARVEIPIDMRAEGKNLAKSMVFPYYVLTAQIDSAAMKGKGTLKASVDYKGGDGAVLENAASFDIELPGGTVTGGEGFMSIAKNGDKGYVVKILVDNAKGGKYFYSDKTDAALVTKLELLPTDEASPPFDLLLDVAISPYCDKPDLSKDETPAADNTSCPLSKPEVKSGGGSDFKGCAANFDSAFALCLIAACLVLMRKKAFYLLPTGKKRV